MLDRSPSIRERARDALLAATLACLLGTATPPLAAGHAFGSFSISVSSQITVAEHEVRVRWVVDMAELPAGVVVDLIDTDGDGIATPAERDAYLALWIPSVLENLDLRVDGADLALEAVTHELSFPVGEGGALSLRLVADLVAPLAEPRPGEVHEATYRDTNYTDYLGWREVAVSAADGVTLVDSSVPVQGRTKELTVYPADLGMSVPSSVAQFKFSVAADAASGPGSPSPSERDLAPAEPSFRLWPTGALAILVVVLLGVGMVALERSSPPRRRR
jgi:hypothetical protein